MPITDLDDKDVVSIIRKNFERKLKKYCKDNNIKFHEADYPPEKEKHIAKKEKRKIDTNVIANGLRVTHTDSKYDYTVIGVDKINDLVRLRSGSGPEFSIPFKTLKKEYEVD